MYGFLRKKPYIFRNFAVVNHETPMTISKQIEQTIERIPYGKAFTIADLGFPAETWEAVRLKLLRMVGQGKLNKAGKGRYFKAETSIFGDVPLSTEELVKDILYNEGGEIQGYLTGYSIWNAMGLTTQIPGVIEIGINGRKGNLKRGLMKVRFIPQSNPITKENVHLLQILDAIKFSKRIPDAMPGESLKRIKAFIANLSSGEQRELITLAEKYPPRVRALIGAIMEEFGLSGEVTGLFKSLNPLTTYKFGVGKPCIANPEKWHIL